MSENQLTKRRVTYTQQLNLWKFLKKHREIAVGHNKSLASRDHSKRMWGRLAVILNSADDGAIKSGTEWSKYWVDLKAKIKRKKRLINDAKTGTGDGSAVDRELSEMESKFLNMLGDDTKASVKTELKTEIQSNPDTSEPVAACDDPVYLFVDMSENESYDDRDQSLASSSNGTRSGSNSPNYRDSSVRKPAQSNMPELSPEQVSRRQRRRQDPRRHQKRHVRDLTGAEVRERLLLASEARAQAELTNSRSIERAISILSEIATIMRRMETRFSGDATSGQEQNSTL